MIVYALLRERAGVFESLVQDPYVMITANGEQQKNTIAFLQPLVFFFWLLCSFFLYITTIFVHYF